MDHFLGSDCGGSDGYEIQLRAPEARVLVVDDTKINITVMRSFLKKTEMKVDVAKSGIQAIKLAEDNCYDVMLIDHMMPEMDGIETLRRIKEIRPDAKTKYLAISSNATEDAREMYLENGFHDFILRPLDKAKLEEMLKECLPEDKIVAV